MMMPIPPFSNRMCDFTWTCQANSKGATSLRIKVHKTPAKGTKPKLKIRILVNGFDITCERAKYLFRPHRFLIYQENIFLFDPPQIPLPVTGQTLIGFDFSFFKILQVFNTSKDFFIMKCTVEKINRR